MSGKTLLWALVILISLNTGQRLQAQVSAGFKGGYNASWARLNLQGQSFTEAEFKSGFQVESFVRLSGNNLISWSIQPGFIEKGYRIARSGPYTGITKTHTDRYIQLPAVIDFNLPRKWGRFFLSLGAFGAYWLSGCIRGTIPNLLDFDNSTDPEGEGIHLSKYHQKHRFDSRYDRRFDFGLIGGAGIAREITTSANLLFTISYFNSLLPFQKSEAVSNNYSLRRSLCVSTGIEFTGILNKHQR